MSQLKFECSSLGFACEWALRADTRQEIVERVREHARCAHNLPELPGELLGKVESAIATA